VLDEKTSTTSASFQAELPLEESTDLCVFAIYALSCQPTTVAVVALDDAVDAFACVFAEVDDHVYVYANIVCLISN
jgi:hypothetical protein